MYKILILAGAMLALFASAAQAAQSAAPAATRPPMTFFVTSVGLGDGANLGGLAGADKHCQALAQSAGAGNKTWQAYLSTQGPGAVNARDRIGTGPWHNALGVQVAADLGDLHGDTLEVARKGNLINKRTAVSEKGEKINGAEDSPNRHDILTGTRLDGTAYTDSADRTCKNWTSNATDGSAQIGHHDRNSGSSNSWNSAHPTRGCSQENLRSTGGDGLLYCFAIN